MQKFDFDKLTERRGTSCCKWDNAANDNVIPLWVADMDFEVAPAIKEALAERVSHGIFGYTKVPDSYYDAITNWFDTRHNWHIEREWILYTTAVIPALSCALKAMTLPGEKVLVQTPVYNCFFSSIRNSGCEVAESRLKRNGDSYVIDFDEFEEKCKDEKVSVFILCNPHNPAGRVWTSDEMAKINEICLRNGVRVIADEIHCEIVMPGYRYTPFASVSKECLDNSVTLTSPSKGFNTAGLQIANIFCSDPALRRRIDRAININEVCDVNPFGVAALQAAYNKGAEWLDQMNAYIHGNYIELKDFCREYLPKFEVLRLEGTYLAWVDINGIEFTADELARKLEDEADVMVNSGTMYGRQAGQGYIRINLACPRQRLREALVRIGRGLAEYMVDDIQGCPM